MKVLLLKTGTTVPGVADRRGDFEQWFAGAMELGMEQLNVVEVFKGADLPAPGAYRGTVVTGSASMVTDEEPWSIETERWLREAVTAGHAVLGVCYGHQLLARALGGVVAHNPRGRNIGTVDVQIIREAQLDPLLGPAAPAIHVPVSHSQAVLELPEGAVRLAQTAKDENHAFAYGPRAWGVQFHPEFDADIVRGYIDARRDQLDIEGLDSARLRREARDTDDGRNLLRRYRQLLDG